MTPRRSAGYMPQLAPHLRRLIPSAILALAFGLRVWRLGEANLWWDEALAVWAVRKGLLGATLWTAGDVHPPLYFWSLWGWVRLVGESELAMRLLSASIGVLTVAAVYALGRLVGGRWVGALAGSLTALSRFHVWWSQELRMYVLAGLACTLSLFFFLRWLRAQRTSADEGGSWAWLGGYVLASAAALYTVFLTGAVVLAQNLVVLAALAGRGYRRRRLLGGWAAAQVAVALPVAGWLALSWGRMRSWSVSEPMPPALFARLYAVLLTTGVSTDIDRLLLYAVLPILILLVGGVLLARGWWRRRQVRGGALEGVTLLLAWTVPAAAVYLATLPRSLFYTPRVEARYFLPFAPAFWTLLGWATVALARRWRVAGYACVAALVALWIGFLPGHYADRHLRDELQTMVRTILSQGEPGDVVLLDSGSRYPIFDYYYRREPTGTAGRPEVRSVPPDDREMTSEAVAMLLPGQVGGARRVWLAEVDVHLTDPERLVRPWLEARYVPVQARAYGHNALFLYDPAGQPPHLDEGYTPQHVLDAPAGTGGHLRGWELPVRRFAPGEVTHVSLLWRSVPQEPVAVSLRDAGGRAVACARLEGDAGQEDVRQQVDLAISRAMPVGEYDVTLSPAVAGRAALGTVNVVNGAPAATAEPAERLSARGGEGIVLEGYTVHAPGGLRPGSELPLDLYWRSEGTPAEDLVVFTHLLGEAYNPRTEGPVWGGHDARPAEGGCPTTVWRAGGAVLDRHVIAVDPDAPEGIYHLEVGLYRAEDGARLVLTLEDGAKDDHVLLPAEVPVVGR